MPAYPYERNQIDEKDERDREAMGMAACFHEEFFALQGRSERFRGVCTECGQLVSI
jgi:hypothetical protein